MNSGLEWDSLLKIICLAISFKAVPKLRRRRRRRHGLYGKTSKQTHHHIWRRPQKAIYYTYPKRLKSSADRMILIILILFLQLKGINQYFSNTRRVY